MRASHLVLGLLLLILGAGGVWWWTGEDGGGPVLEEGGGGSVGADQVAGTEELDSVADSGDREPRREAASSGEIEATAADGGSASPEGPRAGGRVVNSDGEPVSGALVHWTPGTGDGFGVRQGGGAVFGGGEWKSVATGPGGRFTIVGEAAGAHRLSIRAPGFVGYEIAEVVLVEGAATSDLGTIELREAVLLEGLVVDEAGTPVDGVVIHRRLEDGPRFGIDPPIEELATTSNGGRFRIDRMASGEGTLELRHGAYPDRVIAIATGRPGEHLRDLVWELERGDGVSGEVRGVPGDFEGELRVVAHAGTGGLRREGEDRPREGSVDESGRFRIEGLRPGGTYTLTLFGTTPGAVGVGLGRRSIPKVCRAGEHGLTLDFTELASVRFQVVDDVSGEPVTHFRADLGRDFLAPISDAEGRFLREHPEGRVDAPLAAGERAARVRIRADGYPEFEQGGIDPGPGETVDLGVLRLRPAPSVLVTVLDRSSGKPIPGARVYLRTPSEGVVRAERRVGPGGEVEVATNVDRTSTTDESGRARISTFEGKMARLVVTHPDRATWTGPPTTHAVGEVYEELVMLGEGGSARVFVEDSQGEGAVGARVEHRSPGEEQLGGLPGVDRSRTTDSQGRIYFANLEPGVHGFRVVPSDGGGSPGGGRVRVGPGGSDAGPSLPWTEVRVVDGAEAELVLALPELARVHGRVREDGVPLVGATLTLRPLASGELDEVDVGGPGGGGGAPRKRSDGEGEYAFEGILAGTYELVVEHRSRSFPTTVEFTVGSLDREVDVDLTLSWIEGRILDTEGEPVAGAEVWVEAYRPPTQQMGFNIRVSMNGPGGELSVSLGEDVGGRRVTTGDDGRYELRGVPEGVELVVRGSHPDRWPGSSEPLEVAAGARRSGIDLVLAEAGIAEVLVLDDEGEPAPRCILIATFQGNSERPVDPVAGVTDGEGRAEIRSLHPGVWNISAQPMGGGGPSQNPASGNVEVSPGERAGLEIGLGG